MPSGLKRFQKAEALHFITFSCFHRLPAGGAPFTFRMTRVPHPSLDRGPQGQVFVLGVVSEGWARMNFASRPRE